MKNQKSYIDIYEEFFKTAATISNEEEFYNYMDKIKSGEIKTSSILSRISPDSELLKNKNVIIDALNMFGLDFEYVKGVLQKDPQVIATALEKNALALQYVDNPTSDIIKKAISKNYIALKYVCDDFKSDIKNKDFLFEIVTKNGRSLEYLPNFKNDVAFVKAATDNTPYAIRFVGEEIPNEMIISSVKDIEKDILTECITEIKKYTKPYEFMEFYHNINLSLYKLVSSIKQENPKRFENIEFLIELCDINPMLHKLAEPNVKENELFKEKIIEYEKKIRLEPYNLFEESREL